MKKLLPIIVVLVVIAVFLGGMYNGLVQQNEEVDSAWAQVENVLKKRADLIPNLVETVKGYAKHEEEYKEEVRKISNHICQHFGEIIRAHTETNEFHIVYEFSEASNAFYKAAREIYL